MNLEPMPEEMWEDMYKEMCACKTKQELKEWIEAYTRAVIAAILGMKEKQG